MLINGDYMKKKQLEKKLDFKPIGMAMRKARLAEGWTQEEAAEKLGIEQPYYQRLEKYGQYPGLHLLYEITQLYQISLDEFFFPNVRPDKSSTRRQVNALLDKLEEPELQLVENTARSLLRMRK